MDLKYDIIEKLIKPIDFKYYNDLYNYAEGDLIYKINDKLINKFHDYKNHDLSQLCFKYFEFSDIDIKPEYKNSQALGIINNILINYFCGVGWSEVLVSTYSNYNESIFIRISF